MSEAIKANTAEFFGEQATRWVQLYASRMAFRDRLGLFIHSLRRVLPNGGRVLDFGCGPGTIALAASQLGYDVIGADGSSRMVETALGEQKRLGISNAEFAVMDASEFAFGPDSFDAVICSSVIEYVDDDLALLNRLVDSIRPGGYLLLSVPHQASILGKMEDALKKAALITRRQGSRHLGFSHRRYDRRRLLGRLHRLGLDSLRCTWFELPFLGRAGVAASRIPCIGVMMLVVGRKGSAKSNGHGAHNGQRSRVIQTRAMSRKNLWESTPRRVRCVVGRTLSVIPPSTLFGRRFRKQMAFVERAQWWGAEQTREYQLRALRRLCHLAYERSAYHRDVFERVGFHPGDLKSIEDLSALPTTDRETLREHLEDMCTKPPSSRGVDYVSTGGTGGQPLHFYIGSDRSAIEYAYLVGSWRRAGYDLDIPVAVFRGRPVQPGDDGMRHDYDPLLRQHYYSAFHMSEANMGRYLDHVRTLGHCYLHVYPSTVAALARCMRRHGVPRLENVRGIIAESEIVYPDQRELVETVFGCRLFSCYGHSEKTVAATECEYSTDYHVWPTYGHLELLDSDGRAVRTPGAQGEIVGTGFINRVVPFIRYRTGDFATYVSDWCSACGREHPVIREIRGHRTQEVLVARDGSTISWTALNMHDDTFLQARQFQFFQDTPGKATLRVVPADPGARFDSGVIFKRMNAKLGDRIDLTVELVDSLPVSPRGKAIYVDQRLAVAR